MGRDRGGKEMPAASTLVPGLPCTQLGFVSAQGWHTTSLDTLCRQNSRNVQETTDLSLGPQATSSVLESFRLPT